MICARAFDPVEKEYHRLSIMDNGELWYAWKPTCRQPIPEGWIVEWGFTNSDDNPIYENDELRIPWIKDRIFVRYCGAASSRMEVPRFLYEKVSTGDRRDAFRDSRIENLGSRRTPTTKYPERPKPKPIERVDIIGRLQEKRK